MVKILIKDLPESKNMDREAMRAVVGGSATAHFTHPATPYRSQLQPDFSNSLFGWANVASDRPAGL